MSFTSVKEDSKSLLEFEIGAIKKEINRAINLQSNDKGTIKTNKYKCTCPNCSEFEFLFPR